MADCDNQALLLQLLENAGNTGITGEDLMRGSGLSASEFDAACSELWENRRLTGISSEYCCGNGCGKKCAIYLKPQRTWVLKKRSRELSFNPTNTRRKLLNRQRY